MRGTIMGTMVMAITAAGVITQAMMVMAAGATMAAVIMEATAATGIRVRTAISVTANMPIRFPARAVEPVGTAIASHV